MLTPFKLLPFFPVRVRLGVVFVNRNLVEVLARVRVVREHVGWGHLQINDAERWSGWEDGFSVCGKFADADQWRLSLLGKQCHWRSAIHAGQVRTIVEASPLLFFASPFCLYSSLSQPSPFVAHDSAPPTGMASSSSPWQKPSRFKEHLSLSISHPDIHNFEQSKFSPDSPPAHPLRTASLTLAGTPPSLMRARDIPEDIESLRSHGSSTRRLTIRDRFTKIFFDVRTLDERSNSHDGDLISVRPLSPWAPLKLEKEKSPLPTTHPALRNSPPQKKQTKRRFRWWALLLILIILALLGNLAFLNVRVVELTKVIKQNTPPSSTPAPSSPDNVQECLSQFTLNAPSNPSSYPCSTCLPILSNVTGNADAVNAVQFCGLRAILESTSTTGQTALSTGGWGKDLRVCTWSGVSCSGSDIVTSLYVFSSSDSVICKR